MSRPSVSFISARILHKVDTKGAYIKGFMDNLILVHMFLFIFGLLEGGVNSSNDKPCYSVDWYN
jgi:hypothetical protein